MKKIPVEKAIGSVLCHDITQIIPGKFKGRAFKKGHIITEEDIPKLLSMGKDHIYVWEKKPGYLHENEAAERLAKLVAGKGLSFSEVKEGKINFIAEYSGLLKVDKELLTKLNSLESIILATRHNNFPMKKGEKAAGTRVIPLVIEEEKILKAEEMFSGRHIIEVVPYQKLKAGIITTGNEVFYGRITDSFTPVVKQKISEFGCSTVKEIIVPDDSEQIKNSILQIRDAGAEIIILNGGMSVDPDDVTPMGIKLTGANIVSYGAPVLPGAMFLVSYLEDVPVLGLPGCVMYAKTTIFDLVLPRILAGEKITSEDIAQYGHGGLCLECSECRYPYCSFGKGR